MVTLYIKNMVCNRCVMVVQQVFEKQGLQPWNVTLGEVQLKDELTQSQLDQLDKSLVDLGFERIDDHKARLIESIKKRVIQLIHHTNPTERKFNWSTILSEELHYEYNYLSSLFSSVVGITLEQYIIRQKIERVKELLFYDELSLSQIADLLGYSSVAHLSGQFKKITGLTPSDLKKSRAIGRKPLDGVS
ncbi:MAG: helix-turn-helix transcriptional regulator [Cyclobacteriaceae bacterium]|nr:helix-turn-helix transcriptional regulator [Cyclobacteriaceae bacterium]